ncbi:MAG: polyprenyl diphosphate synthase [Candidatus Nezhaarchaeota archaeon]|nr:polyprenyl diphosphate synthase [Candidatus Nezhaarchaeota archaeon]MCX8141513.1 polyprenyl diphosphate synthase [Candidatus Nezhaarchaeota archaeon]MDW8049780.1 polyprenyl diphosphate synthase [Nitrososphaerota archaeon]
MLEKLLKLAGIYWLYTKWLENAVKNKPLPQHVGIILDGNRRWAKSRKADLEEGYKIGAKKVEELLNWCLKLGIKTLTLYAFSIENFKRRPEEVRAVMKVIEETLMKVQNDERLHKYRVKVKALGRLWLLPQSIQMLLKNLEDTTANYSDYYLNVAIAYGGRAEIVDAVRRISSLIVKGELRPDDINEELLERFLYTSHLPNPHPDLIIRTSGEERLSGFLLWQSAYSELCFLDVYWPEFRYIDLLRAIRTYQRRQRRFGV